MRTFVGVLVTVFIVGVLAVALPGSAVAATPFILDQVTENNYFDGPPEVWGGRMVWVAVTTSGPVLMLYDALRDTTVQVSDEISDWAPAPEIHGDLVLWCDFAGGGLLELRGLDLSTGEERLIALFGDDATSISSDGRYVAWTDRTAATEPSDVVLYDWENGALQKLSNDDLDEYAVIVRDGLVVWERESVGDPATKVDVMLHDTKTGQTKVLSAQGQRYRSAYTDAGRVVWLEGPYDQATIMLYERGGAAPQAVVTSPTVKQIWDFRADKIVWTDGWAADGETCVHDLTTGLSTRLSSNTVPDALGRTDGRLVAWTEEATTRVLHVYDCVSRSGWVLSPPGTYAAPPEVDRGRVAWFQGEGDSSEVYSATWPLFADVQHGHPYFEAIQGMGERRLIDGYAAARGAMEFRPVNPVLRAQYAKMIDGALAVTPVETMTAPVDFSDLGDDNPINLYPHEYVWTAYTNEIVRGWPDGTFRPYTSIIRGHVVTMTVRGLNKLFPGTLTVPPAGFTQTWGLSLDKEPRANARTAQHNGLLADLPPDVASSSALEAMPRQEVAQVLYNAMRLLPDPLSEP